MKKKIIIISTIISIILLICFILFIIVNSNDNLKFKYSYEYLNYVEYNNGKKIKVSIPVNNKIKYLKVDEVIDAFNKEEAIIYFGYNSCPWCRNVIRILIDASIDNNVDTIYYVDIHNLNIKKIKDKLYSLLDSYLEEDDDNNKVLAVPDVYFIKNKKIIGHHLGSVDSYKNPFNGMNDKQKKELYDIYTNLIKEMKS